MLRIMKERNVKPQIIEESDLVWENKGDREEKVSHRLTAYVEVLCLKEIQDIWELERRPEEQEGQRSGKAEENDGRVMSGDQIVLHSTGRIKNYSSVILFIQLIRYPNK